MSKIWYIVVAFMSMLFASFGTAGSLFILYIKDIYRLDNITPIAIGATISSGVSIVAMIVMGYLYDRYGLFMPMATATGSMAGWSFCIGYMGRFSSWDQASTVWYVAAVFQGFVMASIMIGLNPTLMTMFPNRRGLAVSVTQSAQALAMSFWSYTSIYLIKLLNFFNALAVMGLIGTTSIALTTIIFSRVRASNLTKGDEDDRHSQNRIEKQDYLSKRLLALSFAMIFFIALSSIVIMSFFAGLIEESFTFATTSTSIREDIVPQVMMVTGFLQALAAILWGYSIDRLGPLKTIPIIYSMETVSTVFSFIVYTVNPWVASLFIALRYIFFSAEPTAHWALIPVLFGLKSLGKISGILNTAPMIASVLAPVAGGLIRDIYGSHRYILTLSIVLSLLSLVFYIVMKNVANRAKVNDLEVY